MQNLLFDKNERCISVHDVMHRLLVVQERQWIFRHWWSWTERSLWSTISTVLPSFPCKEKDPACRWFVSTCVVFPIWLAFVSFFLSMHQVCVGRILVHFFYWPRLPIVNILLVACQIKGSCWVNLIVERTTQHKYHHTNHNCRSSQYEGTCGHCLWRNLCSLLRFSSISLPWGNQMPF